MIYESKFITVLNVHEIITEDKYSPLTKQLICIDIFQHKPGNHRVLSVIIIWSECLYLLK